MIYYNSNTINDWNFGDDNIIKVYKHGAVCYYKITSGDTPTPVQEPCFAVVDDISQYSDTEFEDVFNKADDKWYKLNNLDQYEEYGVYGSGRTITTYEGKLTIDTESTPQPSRLPSGYTEVEYIRQNSNYDAYINTGVILFDNVSNTYTVTTKLSSEFHSNLGCATIINCEELQHPWTGIGYRYKCSSTVDQLEFFATTSNYSSSVVDNGDGTKTITMSYLSNVSKTTDVPLEYFASWNGNYTTPYRFADATIYSATVVKNGTTVRDFVPAKRDSDSVYGLYDLITDTFYTSPNGNNFSGGSEVIPPPITATCEFIYSGGSWVNVGEVSGTSITIKSPEYIEKTSSFRSGYIDLDYVLKDNSMFQLKVKPTNNGGSIVFGQQNSTADNNDYRIFWASSRLYYDYGSDRKYTSQALNNTYEYEVGNYYVKNLATSATVLTGTTKSGTATSMTRKIGMWPTSTSSSDYAQIFYVKIYEGNTLIRDLIPWTDMNGNYGMFDKLSLTTYRSTNALTASTVINDVEVGGGIEYPLEYVVREDPPDNLVFSSMEEAEAYECPWVGMSATIDGDRYVFSGDSQSGYEWVYNPSRLPQGYTEVEYIENTQNGKACIDTNYIPNQDTRILCSYQSTYNSQYGRIWGSGTNTKTNAIMINYEGGVTYQLRVKWAKGSNWTTTSVYGDYNVHTYDFNKNNLYFDGTLVSTTSYTTFQSSDNIALFAYINNGTPPFSSQYQEFAWGKMFYCKIYDNDILVRDFVPCIRDNDSVAGMYDLVNNVFYPPVNYTSYQFVAGPQV